MACAAGIANEQGEVHMRLRGVFCRRIRKAASQALTCAVLIATAHGIASSGSPALAQDSRARVNRLIEALEVGRPALSSETWAFVDYEHNPFDAAAIRKNVLELLANKTSEKPTLAPIVRIPAEGDELVANRWMIKQALESGAMGIIVPKVESAEEARMLVQAMRFPPLRGSKYPEPHGLRGGSGPGLEWGLKSRADYRDAADLWPLNPVGELVALPQVESIAGLENVSAILGVPGVTGVFIGPYDLAQAHGLLDPEHPEVQTAIKTVGAACVAAKKNCGILAAKLDVEQRYLRAGFTIIVRSLYPVH